MPTITLPDGSQRQFENAVTVAEVAESIGAGLARAALAGKVNNKLVDTSHLIESDSELAIITAKDDDGLEVLRHSTAHLLAQATQALFPKAQVTIGPVIDDGFYYDFAYERPFTPEDLTKIEKKMAEIAKQALDVKRQVSTREAAIEHFQKLGEHYKVEIIKDLPAGEEITLYSQGDFTDLCRGPHVPNTRCLQVFKLMKVAGAYWRGDSNNEMLTRVYGTAWPDKKALKAYLHRLEEAEKRDHRKLGKAMDLFHIQEEAPGMIFWHNDGYVLYQIIEQYIRTKLRQADYQEVKTPQIVDRSLWEKSGHWENFKEEMFTTESEKHDFAVKPMSCPCHVQIFNQGLRSYRDLPLRMAEFGACHRNEPSGALHGIMRVRGFVQDDAHIFCTPEQIQQEASRFIALLMEVYNDFGFDEVILKLSTRPEKRVGSDEVWDASEAALAAALNESGYAWDELPGEGAFYGPKIEFSLKDCIGRVWQCGTLQLDYSMPQRLDAQYVAEDGSRQTPVMLHRAILGSFERFIGILIENYAGVFPAWLAPCQAILLNITDNQRDFVEKAQEILKNRGIRVKTDLRNEKIGYKIREHTLKRVPYMLVVGDKEVAEGTLNVRNRAGENLGTMSIEAFADFIDAEVARFGRQD